MFRLKYIYQEEEGGGGSGGGYCYSLPPEDEHTLYEWWKEVITGIGKYPIYAIIISADSNRQVYNLIDQHREDIRAISGSDICFVYFREYEKARDLEVWSYREHKKYAIKFGQVLGISGDSIIFMNPQCLSVDGVDKDMLVLPLKNKDTNTIFNELNQLFANYYSSTEEKPIDKLRSAKNNLLRTHAFESVVSYASSIVKETSKQAGKILIGVLG